MNAKMFKLNCLVRIKVPGVMGNSRKVKVSDDQVWKAVGPLPDSMRDEEKRALFDAAKERMTQGKKLVVCPELKAATSAVSAVKSALVSEFCNPSFIDDGWFLVRLASVEAFNGRLRELNARITEPVEAFADVLPAQVEIARRCMGAEFNADHYPTPEAIRAYPGVSASFISFEVPEGLPPEIRAEEEAKLRAQFAEASKAIVGALWSEFAELVAHIVGRLTPGEDGKPKTFQKGTVENLTQFIGAFENRNAFNDENLAEVVKRAKGIIESVGGIGGAGSTSEKLRDFEAIRVQTRDAFGALKIQIDAGVAELPTRAFSFDE